MLAKSGLGNSMPSRNGGKPIRSGPDNPPEARLSERDEAPPERGRQRHSDEQKQDAAGAAWLRSMLRRRPLVAASLALVVVLGVAGSLIWWLQARQFESTDDAFIRLGEGTNPESLPRLHKKNKGLRSLVPPG